MNCTQLRLGDREPGVAPTKILVLSTKALGQRRYVRRVGVSGDGDLGCEFWTVQSRAAKKSHSPMECAQLRLGDREPGLAPPKTLVLSTKALE